MSYFTASFKLRFYPYICKLKNRGLVRPAEHSMIQKNQTLID